MKIRALQCKRCNTVIFSRAQHDFRRCSCEDNLGCSIDGGFDLCRVSGNPKNIKWVNIEIPCDKAELYDDWNTGTNKWGKHTKAELKKLNKRVK